MLTSQTDRKSACKTYIQLILGKKSKKFVLTTQNCPVCIHQRDDISLATPGTARLVGKAGCLQRLRVLLVSRLPTGDPPKLLPLTDGWGVGSHPFRAGDIQLRGHGAFFIAFFFFHLPAHTAASLCCSVFFCKVWARELMPCVFPGKPTRTISEIKFRHTKVKV